MLTLQGEAATQTATTFYHHAFVPLVVVTLFLAWRARPSTEEEIPQGFRRFQVVYLSVWALCAAADWLQGPYVYALYSAYNYSRHEIAQLFVAGFASSLVFSCFVGALCDRFGRKKCAIMYAVLYIISCLTKHIRSFSVLMFGRITGGIATSLLFSCFECWMVSEHLGRKRFSNGLLSYMFGLMYTVNYLVAIFSGVVGEFLNSGFKFHPASPGSMLYFGGALCPFDLAIICLVIGWVFIAVYWEENYGQDRAASGVVGPQQGLVAKLHEALWLLRSDYRMALLGLAVASFEGSMYAFVFNWTPALASKEIPPPYGFIFALFMMSCMCGASMSTLLDSSMPPLWRLAVVMAISTATMVVSAAACEKEFLRLCFAAFCLFEFCVGVYFPSIGILKSEVVPERVRGTMYNLYRVPLNTVVVVALLTDMSIRQVYSFCAVLLALGTGSVVLMNYLPPCKGLEALNPKEV